MSFLAKNTFGKRDEIDEDALSQIFASCDLLIIDDLGRELLNSFCSFGLLLCLNERILRKATIISTNLSLEDIKQFILNDFFTYQQQLFYAPSDR